MNGHYSSDQVVNPSTRYTPVDRSKLRDPYDRYRRSEREMALNDEPKRRVTQIQHHRKMEATKTLAGGIAHHFNNILVAMIGYTELTQVELPKDSEVQANLQQVLIAGARAKELVQQILAFSHNSAQERQPVSLSAMIEEKLTLLRNTLPSTVTIHHTIEQTSCAVFADPMQMQQVVMNLCTNAEYAMRETGGRLEISLTTVECLDKDTAFPSELSPGTYVRLVVRDTGSGMSPEVLDRMFEPFFTTKPVDEGMGMGLAVAYGIVTSHGGAIMAESRSGEGATFVVFLPRI